MKTLSFLFALLLVSCIWHYTHREPPPLPPPAPAPVVHHYAKEGTFFVLEYISVPTPKGPIGFEPGREVHFVKAFPDRQTLLVSDGQYQVEVDPKLLTNDLDIAEFARKQDEAGQLQIAAYQESQSKAYHAQRQKLDVESAARIQALEEARAKAVVIGGSDTLINQPAKATGPIWQSPPYQYGSPYWYFYNQPVSRY